MNKRFTFLLWAVIFVAAMFLWQCRRASDSQQGEQAQQSSGELPVLRMDSLQKEYERLMKMPGDRLPVKQIQEAGRLYPVDEGPLDTSFFVFREWLLGVIAQKDVLQLMHVVDPDIRCTFGEENGVAVFVNTWGLDTPAKTQRSPLWAELSAILRGGGIFDAQKQNFTAPYWFATFPDDADALESGVILGSGVRLRATPDVDSEIVQTISYNIVALLEVAPEKDTIGSAIFPWYKVKLSDGKEGYVFGQFLGSPLGYRAGFARLPNNSWRMNMLVAGD